MEIEELRVSRMGYRASIFSFLPLLGPLKETSPPLGGSGLEGEQRCLGVYAILPKKQKWVLKEMEHRLNLSLAGRRKGEEMRSILIIP